MHPRIRLTLDLIKSFHRADHKLKKLSAYSAYYLSHILGDGLPSVKEWRARNPLHAYILMTSRCNMTCEDCFFVDIINEKSVGRLDFDIQQVKKNYENSIFQAVARVILFGGEPTLCKDNLETIRFFRSRGIVVSMTSNALKINRETLLDLKAADLNILNLSIYEKTGQGVKRNLENIEEAFEAANAGAFDPERIEVSYHAVDVESYRRAYEFASKIGARHLLFNRTFYTETNPKDGEHSESSEFAREYLELCAKIEKENVLNLYHASQPGTPNTCSFTENAFSISPTDAMSPCCMVTPDKEKYGSIDQLKQLYDFKDAFLAKQVPDICKECHVLGVRHF